MSRLPRKRSPAGAVDAMPLRGKRSPVGAIHVIAATLLVAVGPAAFVWGLRAGGIVNSTLLGMVLGAALSLAACQLGARLWERRRSAGDVLFGDLLVWGWIVRAIQQRRLDSAARTLGLRWVEGASDPMTLTMRRRVRLLERLATQLEAGDPHTHGHSRRVARYAAMIAKRLHIGGAELARIRTAAAVHDVGKLELPAAVLQKPGRLTDAEFELIKGHPVQGAGMVSILEDDALTAIVMHHHERLDGAGYPSGLRGEQIPLGARIIAVADTFDAITSARPYRAAKPHKEAIDILRAEAGRQLDPDAVSAFCAVYHGRRPLAAWVAVTNLAERLAGWLGGDAVLPTARAVAVAATTAAVGGGAIALPAVARRVETRALQAGAPHARAGATVPGVVKGGEILMAHVASLAALARSSWSRESARPRELRVLGGRPGLGRQRGTAGLGPAGPGAASASVAGTGTAAGAPASGGSGGAGSGDTGARGPGSRGGGAGSGSGAGGSGSRGGGGSSGSGGSGGVTKPVSGVTGRLPVSVTTGTSSSPGVGIAAGGNGLPPATVTLGLGGGPPGAPPVTIGSGSAAGTGQGSGPGTGGGVGVGVNVPGVASVHVGIG